TVEKSARRLPAKYKYPVILFEPHDLNLVGGPPSRRRDYFDRIFGDLSEEYATNLSKFNKALRQRNELLKSETLSPADLFAWNLLLSDYGSSIANVRAELSNLINKSLDSTYHSIAENNDHVSLSYSPVKSSLTKEIYLSELERSFERDHIIGYTTFGIQRDTFDFIFNEKMADGSASRGETRSIILALKFVEAGLLASHSSEKPLILLDDVFSELDDTRRHALVENFKNHQVVITSVEDVKI
ncbi:DNA replication and repair protein RecF, partial [Candidatus Saccharibacteria bacterium]|nr:DNA replication and repair protein RecF [Candidatus Saccharibacteria bacterium]